MSSATPPPAKSENVSRAKVVRRVEIVVQGGIDLAYRCPVREQRGDDRTGAGANEEVEPLMKEAALKCLLERRQDADLIEKPGDAAAGKDERAGSRRLDGSMPSYSRSCHCFRVLFHLVRPRFLPSSGLMLGEAGRCASGNLPARQASSSSPLTTLPQSSTSSPRKRGSCRWFSVTSLDPRLRGNDGFEPRQELLGRARDLLGGLKRQSHCW